MDQSNQAPANDTTQNARPISEVASEAMKRIVDRPQRSEDEWARYQRQQREREISGRWSDVVGVAGCRYTRCFLDEFERHGAAADRERQDKVIAQLQELQDSLKEHVESGRGLVLLGPCGVGKDFLMMALLRAAVLRDGLTARWVNGQDLAGAFRDRIDTGESEARLVESYGASNVLAISDPVPPKGEGSAYVASLLYRIIDRRYRNIRSTWVTMNVASREEADQRLTPQVVDRLLDGALVVKCNWPSYRKALTF